MAASPVAVLSVILCTLAFEGLLFGTELAEKSFPSFDAPAERNCGALQFLCDTADAVAAAFAVIQGIWGVFVFFFNLLTFNIPGAPWFVRLVAGGALGGGIIWSLAGLFRGN